MGRPVRFFKTALALCLTSACSAASDKAPGPGVMPGGDGGGSFGRDSSVTTDGAVLPSDDAGDGFRACTESADRFRAQADLVASANFSLIGDGLDFHVAYLTPTCIGVDGNGTAHGLRYVSMPSAGAPGTPVDVAYADGESCVRMQHPALTRVDGALTLSYSAAPDGPWEVYGRSLEASDATQLSSTRNRARFNAVDAENIAGARFTVWAEDNASGNSTLWVAKGEDAASERVLLASDAGYHMTNLALRGIPQVGKGKVRAALAFVSDSGERPGVFLLALDADMKVTSDTPTRLSDAAPGTMSVDLQARGVLYTAGTSALPDLRFRALNEQAAPVGDEIRITSVGEQAAAGSLTPFTVGYAIAYRSVRADEPERAFLRLSLIDPQGNIAGYRNLFETSAAGGKVLIRTAVDGRMAVAFRELGDDGVTELHVARITCGL